MNPFVTSLLKQLLAGAAQEALQKTSEAAAPTQRPCDVGIVFATPGESGGFEDRLDGLLALTADKVTVKQGGLAGRHVALTSGGIGQAAARRAAERLIVGHRPAWLISAGFAGGLVDSLARGDFLLANDLVDLQGRRMQIAVGLEQPTESTNPRVHVGRLLTVDRVICRPQQKRELGQTHQALAVDMETMAVAAACQEHKTRFLSVRLISDDVNEALPEELNRILGSDHLAHKLGVALGSVWSRPGVVKDYWKLREHTLTDSDRLAQFLMGVVTQLAQAAVESS